MPNDTRLSRMLHVLIHMDHIGAPVTSEVISRMLDTNPVVVRRTMAGLRAAGYLTSVKGHGGGWALARPLDEVTLRDIHDALGRPLTEEEAEELASLLTAKFGSDIEVSVINGGQPVYYFIISVE